MDFGDALARLFVQAGRPTLRAAAARSTVSAQRISDWRNGRHLPRDFATVEPLLVWLTARAVSDGQEDVLAIPQWKDLWDQHLTETDNAGAGSSTPTTIARPYAGLATLTAADRALFFGRDDLVHTLVDTIFDAAASSGPRLVIVAGVSGSGKSSLLDAGLARDPRLPTPRRAGITAGGVRVEDGAPRDADDTAAVPDVIVLDQFEDVFSLSDDLVVGCIEEVAALADEAVVVLGVRADFFGQCVEFPLLAQAWQTRCVIVSEMTGTQLREVITGPVRLAGGRIESGLADVMIADLHAASTVGDRAGRLPLLAHVLAATWSRRSGNRMTISGYRATGGIARAVADTAEAAWSAVDPADHNLARALLMALVHVGPAGIALRMPLHTDTIADRFGTRVSGIIDVFAQARLIIVSSDSVMLIHDVVLTSWPRLAEWIAADSGIHLWRQQLDTDTTAWVAAGRSRSFLYTGSRLDTARSHRATLRRNYQHLLSAENEAFLDAALAQQRRLRMVRVASIGVVVVLAVVSTITAVFAFRQAHDLEHQRNNAERAALLSHIDSLQQTNPSLAARLLLVADGLYPDDQSVRQRVLGAATSPLSRPLTGHTGPVYDVSFDADGSHFASASGDRTARLWERTDDGSFRSVATLTGYGNYLTSTTFHPTRGLLATGSGDGTVRIWDISRPDSPRQTISVAPGHGTVYLVRFSPDGRHLAASSDDGTVTIYAVADDGSLRETSVLTAHVRAARTVSYSADGRLLATGGDDRVVRLWDTTDPDHPVPAGPPITGFPSITHSVAFSPDSRTLAVTGDSPNAQLWNVADPAHATPLSGSLPDTTAGSWSIAYGPRGDQTASARADGSLMVWNTVNPAAPVTQWTLQSSSGQGTPEQGSVRTFSTTFGPDGDSLLAGRSDGTIDLWHLPPAVIPDRGGTVTGLATGADRRVLASVGTDTTLNVWTDGRDGWRQRSRTPIERRVNDHPSVTMNPTGTQAATANNNGGRVQIWDVTDRNRPVEAATLAVDTRYTNAVAYAPVGNMLATGATDTTVQLWDTTDPRRPTRVGVPLTGPGDLIRSVAFSPDGRRLAVTSDDKRTYLYDLDTGSSPVTVITDSAPATRALFTADGETLIVASRDLRTWDVRDGRAVPIDRRPDTHAVTLSLSSTRLVVGTATHHLMTYALDADGHLDDDQAIVPLIKTTDTTTTWQLPDRMARDDQIITGGDVTGTIHLQTTDPASAQRWICSTTAELTPDQRSMYLPHTDIPDECD
ncbi:NACHT and WD repeat domain-containing protein [Gordonia sp. CPCC 206044]|uniref:NACHT and WD repeat domain-containing protein n=1 Tax=Gordonia sp. CPCC 206044 TaxID=3140793 RepID=UPI003AF38DC9